VLLSPGFVPGFRDFGRIGGDEKFACIPNMLSFPVQDAGSARVGSKDKVCLMVSRFDERDKNILGALRVWKAVKSDPASEGWVLRLVGHGEDGALYRRVVERDSIPDVEFLGRQDPREHYRSAAVFLMTSRSEGWGLTLTEAQQFGVVPVVFDTFESLRDIVEDGVSGFAVPWGDEGLYASRVLELMGDAATRNRMARAAYGSSLRFLPENVAPLWRELLDGVADGRGARGI
jgi:glycosyltransferase involved in cell wall biosynthesis